MALYIVTNGQQEKVYNIPFRGFNDQTIHSVSHILADGDELETITELFCNRHLVEQNYIVIPSIPLPKSRVAIWYGDIAKTILANL